jgi:hypothetical protein
MLEENDCCIGIEELMRRRCTLVGRPELTI